MTRIIITILLLLTSNLAYSADLFTPSANDISLKIVGSIFGGLLDSGGQDPLLNAIKIFNGCILILGGLLAGYTVLAGTMGTAHDGEMMGKKFSSVWIPIRYSIGTALLLPVVSGGYATIQALVMWLVVQGVGLADQVWDTFKTATVFNQQIKLPSKGKNSALQLTENAFLSYVCIYGNQRGIDEVPRVTEAVMKYKKTYDFGITPVDGTYFFGNKLSKTAFKDCGFIQPPSYNYQAPGQATAGGLLGQISIDFTPIDVSPIVKAHQTATTEMMNEVSSLTSELIGKATENFDAKSYYSRLVAIADNYDKTVNTASSQFISTYKNNSKSSNGWIESGYLYKKIIDDNNTLNTVSSSVSNSSASLARSLDNTWFADSTVYLDVAKAVLLYSKNSQIDNFTINKDGGTEKVESGSSLINKVATAIGQEATGLNLFELKDDFRHPVIIASDMGDRIFDFNIALTGSIAGVGLVVGTIAGIFGNGVSSAMNVISMFLFIPFAFLWGVGAICKFLIPFLPAFYFTGVLIGWLLLVAEGIIAAPIWVVAHLNPKGDDLTGTAQAGYSLLLSLVLRPVLIIFGLMFSMILSNVIGEFINKVFFPLLMSLQGGSLQGFAGLATIIFGTTIYAILILIVVSQTFTLMYKLPDQILRWIGGSTGGLGEFAGSFESASKQGLAGGTAAMVGDLSRLSGGASSKLSNIGKSLQKPPGNTPNNNPKDSSPNVSSDSNSSNDSNDNTEQSYSSQMSQQPSKNTSEGQVLDFGHAPYKNREDGKPSYFVKLQTKDGEVTRWGKEIEKNLQSSNIGVGDNISITRLKNEDGKLTSHFSIERKDEEPKS